MFLIDAVAGFHGPDGARHRRIDHAVFEGLFHILGLLALVGKLIVFLADLQLLGLDAHLNLVLLELRVPGELGFQVLHLGFAGLDTVLQAQDIQLKLLKSDLHALHVVAEEALALDDLVSGGDEALLHGQVLIRIHLDDVLGLHHTGVSVFLPGRAHARDDGHGLDVDRSLLGRLGEVGGVGVPAAITKAAQNEQGQQDFQKGLHISLLTRVG